VRLLLSIIVFLSGFTQAAARVDSAVRAFEARYRHSSTLAATFLERYSENGRLVRASAGTAYFRRPGRMRWEYEAPEKNLFLVDGKFAWFLVPSDHTATRVPAKQSADWRTPLALLAGEARLSKVCSALAPAKGESPERPEDVVLFCALRGSQDKLEPGAAPPGKSSAPDVHDTTAYLELNPSTGELSRVLVKQPGGISLEFKFANWQFNPSLPESLFHFAPAPGIAIVNGELPSSENPANP
jgi:outer membrane lipoprotein carrier protein